MDQLLQTNLMGQLHDNFPDLLVWALEYEEAFEQLNWAIDFLSHSFGASKFWKIQPDLSDIPLLLHI